ncbi:hypothetical protein FQA39_LY13416 [Lamprigera yunnana]|nr:hypothetical protein FQA39_LY13416 [Lamprigera yunnana]
MALSMWARKSSLLKGFLVNPLNLSKYFLCSHNRLITLEPDVLDNFTTQLMQRKSDKWVLKKITGNANCKQQPAKLVPNQKVQLNTVNLEKLDNILQEALENDDEKCIRNAVYWCIANKKIPNLSVLIQILSLYSHAGDKDIVIKLVKLCEVLDTEILKQYSNFKHYLAEAIWVKGNIKDSINLFESLYVSNPSLRRIIRNMLKYLIKDGVANRSEAVLLNIIEFAQRLIENYNDFYILCCIWKCCIVSEWFTDQSIAINMLDQNPILRKKILNDLLFVTNWALQNHHTEIVYKILEVLLKYEHKACYAQIVEALFDYRVYQRDVRGCKEIFSWCTLHNVELSMFQQQKYATLVVSTASNLEINVDIKLAPKPPDYNFKF